MSYRPRKPYPCKRVGSYKREGKGSERKSAKIGSRVLVMVVLVIRITVKERAREMDDHRNN